GRDPALLHPDPFPTRRSSDLQRISDVQSQYDIIAVAFADATATPGAVTFNLDTAGLNGYTVAQFKADIRAKQAAGKKVIISVGRSEEHTSELQSRENLVCRLL